MKIWVAPYELVSLQNIRHGCLLKFEFLEGTTGFADCHPWPELGDLPLENQLQILREEGTTSLLSQSLALAQIDAEARRQKKNCFENLHIPKSHYLVIDRATVQWAEIRAQGWTHIKIKIGRDPQEELAWLNKFEAQLTDFHLRLDANGRFESAALLAWYQRLSPSLRARIEFIEDPTPSLQDAKKIQQETNWAVARDFENPQSTEASYDVRVLKPAVQDIQAVAVLEPIACRLVVTSYLDHPLGQVTAAWQAARLQQKYRDRVGICGLLSHHVYKPTEFSRALSAQGPQFCIPDGWGFGLDDLLHKQGWQRWI